MEQVRVHNSNTSWIAICSIWRSRSSYNESTWANSFTKGRLQRLAGLHTRINTLEQSCPLSEFGVRDVLFSSGCTNSWTVQNVFSSEKSY